MTDSIDILGTKYKFNVVKDEDFPRSAEGSDGGLTKYYDKEIIINGSTKYESIEDYKRIIRHEIIHAFFFESGLSEYTNNEQLVDFLAYQIPKMVKIFEKAESED
jgi:hypothetical protein